MLHKNIYKELFNKHSVDINKKKSITKEEIDMVKDLAKILYYVYEAEYHEKELGIMSDEPNTYNMHSAHSIDLYDFEPTNEYEMKAKEIIENGDMHTIVGMIKLTSDLLTSLNNTNNSTRGMYNIFMNKFKSM